IGSKSTDIIYSPDLNQVRPNTLGYAAVKDTRPYKDWNVVTTRDNGPRINYNAGTLDVTKRFSNRVAFDFSYTLAYSKGNQDGAVPSGYGPENGTTTLDRYDIERNYGNVPYTRRHRFVGTFLWQLPFGHGPVLGGWETNGIFVAQSGPYLTPFYNNSADPSGTGANVRGFTGADRPDFSGTGDGSVANPTADHWLDRGAFAVPANNIARCGDVPVSPLTGPGTWVFSLTLAKNFNFGQTQRVRFEASAANLFNHLNLGVPDTNIGSSSFGRITSTQTRDQAGPRTVQLSLRYSF